MRPSRRVKEGCEALRESWEGSQVPEKVASFSRRAGWGQEALQKWAEGVGRPFQRAWMDREALEEGQKVSGVPSGDPRGVGRPFPDGWVVSGGPQGGSGGVRRPIRMAGGLEALQTGPG